MRLFDWVLMAMVIFTFVWSVVLWIYLMKAFNHIYRLEYWVEIHHVLIPTNARQPTHSTYYFHKRSDFDVAGS